MADIISNDRNSKSIIQSNTVRQAIDESIFFSFHHGWKERKSLDFPISIVNDGGTPPPALLYSARWGGVRGFMRVAFPDDRIQWLLLAAIAAGSSHMLKNMTCWSIDRLGYDYPAQLWKKIQAVPTEPAEYWSMYGHNCRWFCLVVILYDMPFWDGKEGHLSTNFFKVCLLNLSKKKCTHLKVEWEV